MHRVDRKSAKFSKHTHYNLLNFAFFFRKFATLSSTCTVRDTSFVHPTVEAPPWKIHGVHRVSPCSTECYFFIHRNPPRRTVEVGQTSIAELCLDHRVCEKLVTVYNLH